MKQVLFRIPGLGISVYGFGFMVVIAVAAGLALAVRRSRREGLDPEVLFELTPWLLLGGLVGARLYYVAEYWGETVNTIGQIFRVWEGGIVFYGSVVGGAVGFLLFRVWRAFPVLATLDALAPSLALGVALGRVGCFLNGCCYGRPCDLPWLAVQFPQGSLPWLAEHARGLIPVNAVWSLPLHPTQLYSAIDGLILFALATTYYPLRRRDGEVIGLVMLAYPVLRFLTERLRGDEKPMMTGLTIAQVSSLFALAIALFFWSRLSRRPPKRWADPRAGELPG
jgi:phosphatidylglycerol---prolipoprotein diacylglyceryl transferase